MRRLKTVSGLSAEGKDWTRCRTVWLWTWRSLTALSSVMGEALLRVPSTPSCGWRRWGLFLPLPSRVNTVPPHFSKWGEATAEDWPWHTHGAFGSHPAWAWLSSSLHGPQTLQPTIRLLWICRFLKQPSTWAKSPGESMPESLVASGEKTSSVSSFCLWPCLSGETGSYSMIYGSCSEVGPPFDLRGPSWLQCR